MLEVTVFSPQTEYSHECIINVYDIINVHNQILEIDTTTRKIVMTMRVRLRDNSIKNFFKNKQS